eukprot:g2655.t1
MSNIIKGLHDTGRRIGWRQSNLAVIKRHEEQHPAGVNVYIQRGGPLNDYPITYAVYYGANIVVINYILDIMVTVHKYDNIYLENVKNGMVTSLFDLNDAAWRKTTLNQIKAIYDKEVERKKDLDILNSWNGIHQEIPLYYAIWGEARLEVVEFLCTNMGIENVLHWRDEYGWTLLHYIVKWNRPHLIGYMLHILGEDFAEIRNDKGRMPYEYAEMHNKVACLELLMNPDQTVKKYVESIASITETETTGSLA